MDCVRGGVAGRGRRAASGADVVGDARHGHINMKYLFSWSSPETYLGIKRRKWWKFWAHDKLVEHHTETRHAALFDEHEAARLQRLLETDTTLLRKLMARGDANNAFFLQLENVTEVVGYEATEYITTEGA